MYRRRDDTENNGLLRYNSAMTHPRQNESEATACSKGVTISHRSPAPHRGAAPGALQPQGLKASGPPTAPSPSLPLFFCCFGPKPSTPVDAEAGARGQRGPKGGGGPPEGLAQRSLPPRPHHLAWCSCTRSGGRPPPRRPFYLPDNEPPGGGPPLLGNPPARAPQGCTRWPGAPRPLRGGGG